MSVNLKMFNPFTNQRVMTIMFILLKHEGKYNKL